MTGFQRAQTGRLEAAFHSVMFIKMDRGFKRVCFV